MRFTVRCLRVMFTSAFAAGVLGALAAHALAQQSCDELECPEGYACTTYQAGTCSVGACDEEGDCPEPVCETFDYAQCVPAPCASDADCPDSMRCHEESYFECSGGMARPCAADEECPEPEPPTCTETTQSTCAPKYTLPCDEAADCGPGFDCVQDVYYECDAGGADGSAGSGAAGTGTAGAGEPMPDPSRDDADPGVMLPPGECHEVSADTHHCQLQDLPCDSDTDCPGDLQCVSQPVWTCPTVPPENVGTGGGSAMGGSGAVDDEPMAAGEPAPPPDGDDGGVYECTQSEGQSVCMPQDYYGGYPGGGAGGAGGGDQTPPEYDPMPGTGNSAGTGSAEEPTGTGGQGGSDADDGSDSDSHHHRHHGHHRGIAAALARLCSVGTPGGASDHGAWLMPLSLAGLLALRRRRARLG